jgi:hypothetical protein
MGVNNLEYNVHYNYHHSRLNTNKKTNTNSNAHLEYEMVYYCSVPEREYTKITQICPCVNGHLVRILFMCTKKGY